MGEFKMMRSFICSTLALLLVISTQAFAAQPEVTITEVYVDYDYKTIAIKGKNFDLGPDPTTVSLGGFGGFVNLHITTNTSTLLVVDFPSVGLQEGVYTLAVRSGPGRRKKDTESITIKSQFFLYTGFAEILEPAGKQDWIRARENTATCLHKKRPGWDNGNPIHLWACTAGPEENKTWRYDPATGYIRSAMNPNKCLHKKKGGWDNGNPIHLWDCDAGVVEFKTWRIAM